MFLLKISKFVTAFFLKEQHIVVSVFFETNKLKLLPMSLVIALCPLVLHLQILVSVWLEKLLSIKPLETRLVRDFVTYSLKALTLFRYFL